MKFSKTRLSVLVALAGLILTGFQVQALPVATADNKVIIYPTGNETISQLKELGIANVDNYGSYWIAQATDHQFEGLKATYGSHVFLANYLNRISLRFGLIDTSNGKQFDVPAKMRESQTDGRRLRLIQFKGPIQPEWLADLNRLTGLKIVNYVPNNAYLVFMDGTTEKQVNALQQMGGPVQWIGPYHPYYKINTLLLSSTGVVDINLAVVDSPEGEAALKEIASLADRSTDMPHHTLNQINTKIRCNASFLGYLAHMPEVLWIEPVIPIKLADEVQALIVSSHTNNTVLGIGGPVPPGSGGETYLNFLTNAVGGGSLPTGMLPAFTNAATYPIIDIADTGFTDPGGDFDFFPFGNPLEGFERYRVAYETFDFDCGTFAFQKSTDSNGLTCIPKFTLAVDDFAAIPHGTAIASIIAGFNTNALARDSSGFQFGMGISPFGQVGSTRVFEPVLDVIDGPSCAYNIFETFCNTDSRNLAENEYRAGGRIANNSWSEDIITHQNDGLYNSYSQSYDVSVRDAAPTGQGNTGGTPLPFPQNQEFIVVFANGNWGNQENPGGFVDVTVTPPGTAKNVISVGATENVRLDGSGCLPRVDQDDSYDIAIYSSFGPTSDGRFKPEIVAPGGPIYAVGAGFWTNYVLDVSGRLQVENPPVNLYRPGPDPTYFCTFNNNFAVQFLVGTNIYGTSYSAPAVSGSIQLLWWYFQNRLNMLQPSPAMAKAYLLNSARYLPITNSFGGFVAEDSLPSVAQGMGELDLRRMFDGVPRVLRDESTPRAIDPPLITTNPVPQQTFFSKSGQSYEVSGLIASNGPFRVTVAWTDAAGAPQNGVELVNDLNLEVTVGGQTYFGNRFNGHNSVPTTTGGGAATPDTLNPVESVFLDPALVPAVTSGAPWQVTIRAANITSMGVPNTNTGTNSAPNQDFALVVYNTTTNFATESDTPISPSLLPNQITNNICANAIGITQFPYTFTNSLTRATYSNVHPSPSVALGGIDEFFVISKPTPGTVFTIDTVGSRFDTVLSVWSVQVVPQAVFLRGECGFLSEVVADNDANGGLQSQVSFTADGSNDYFIVVEPHNNGGGGTMVLNAQATRPPITVTPPSLAFSDQVVGTTSASQAVTYQNGSPATVRIDTATITGADPNDFIIVSQDCQGDFLTPGTNCFVTVAFSPTAIGARQANLVFTDDATGSPRTVPLSGNATPAAPLVCLSSGSGSGSNTFNFGSQLLTTTSAVQSITITNCGSAPLNISSVSVAGPGSNNFLVTQPLPCIGAPIAPGNFCTINVAFNPQVAGTQNSPLVITSDAAGSPTALNLTGVGLALAPSVCFASSPINFAGTVVGFTGSVQTVTLTNCGTAPLVISNLVLTGANTGDFTIVSSTCTTVATGGTCAVSLQFAPTVGGPRSANLVFVDNVPGGPTVLALSGNASLSQPDAAIGKTTKAKKMLGNGIVNTTGAGQEFIQKIHRGAKKGLAFYVTLRNIGSSADRFTVLGDGDVTGFTVNYFLGASPKDSTDITTAVESGTFSSSTLAPAAITSDSTIIRIEVFADKTLVQKGVSNTFRLTFTSVSDPTKVDVVKATVTAK